MERSIAMDARIHNLRTSQSAGTVDQNFDQVQHKPSKLLPEDSSNCKTIYQKTQLSQRKTPYYVEGTTIVNPSVNELISQKGSAHQLTLKSLINSTNFKADLYDYLNSLNAEQFANVVLEQQIQKALEGRPESKLYQEIITDVVAEILESKDVDLSKSQTDSFETESNSSIKDKDSQQSVCDGNKTSISNLDDKSYSSQNTLNSNTSEKTDDLMVNTNGETLSLDTENLEDDIYNEYKNASDVSYHDAHTQNTVNTEATKNTNNLSSTSGITLESPLDFDMYKTVIQSACQSGNLELLRDCLTEMYGEHPKDFKTIATEGLSISANNNKVECFKVLLAFINGHYSDCKIKNNNDTSIASWNFFIQENYPYCLLNLISEEPWLIEGRKDSLYDFYRSSKTEIRKEFKRRGISFPFYMPIKSFFKRLFN